MAPEAVPPWPVVTSVGASRTRMEKQWFAMRPPLHRADLRSDAADLNTLGVFCTGVALGLIFCFGRWLLGSVRRLWRRPVDVAPPKHRWAPAGANCRDRPGCCRVISPSGQRTDVRRADTAVRFGLPKEVVQ